MRFINVHLRWNRFCFDFGERKPPQVASHNPPFLLWPFAKRDPPLEILIAEFILYRSSMSSDPAPSMSSGVELSNVPSTRRTVHAEDSPNEASIGSKQSVEENRSSTISSESLEQAKTSNSELGNFLSDYHKGLWKQAFCKEDGVSYISVPKQCLGDLISTMEPNRVRLAVKKAKRRQEKLRMMFRQVRERDEVLNQELILRRDELHNRLMDKRLQSVKDQCDALVLDKEELMLDKELLYVEKESLEQKLANAEGEIANLKAAFAHLADKHGRE